MSMIAPGGMPIVQTGIEDGISWAMCRAPIYGALNGYALIPHDHPWHGMNYEDMDVEIHGCLTYGDEDNWVGFDTLHGCDYWPGRGSFFAVQPWSRHWTEEQVVDECRSLARQIAKAAI